MNESPFRRVSKKDPPAAVRSPRSTTLPPDLLQDAVRRLRAVVVLVALVATANFTVFTFLIDHSPLSAIDAVAMPSLIAASVAMLAVTRLRKLPAKKLLAIGLAYEVVVAFLIGLLVNEGPWPADRMMPSWSPIAIWILIYPIMVPSRWKTALPVALLGAAMDPLTLGIVTWMGAAPPSIEIALARFTPSLLSVVMGTVTSQIIYHLGEQVGEARRAGGYELLEKIGQGGMGEVWRARHRLLARPAAVKLIRPVELAAASVDRIQEARIRFETEARSIAALRSPHTVVLYDYGVTREGRFYYVMELLDGFDLETFVNRFGPVPASRAVFLLQQACHSLAEAHAAGMVHRDLKPSNIAVCRMGLDCDFVKVLDFGLVKYANPTDESSTRVTQDGLVAGTPAFLAPEIALGNSPIGPAADVYTLGCVVYWLLTGRLVFEDDAPVAVIAKHIREAPTPPSQRTEIPIPETLDRLVMDCLEKDPADRPRDAAELRDRLSAIPLESEWTGQRARAWWQTHAPIAETRQ